ncbi:hypothetical protein AB6N24_15040 [Cellulomonas sp. 179-A 4D5 NHS]|uniref:hypothetical protein n=1 Tax=Cellulomonas sp. 179-A 4D5 NHS TaxID=3142378 RepID=UPI0039A3447A
MRPDITMPVAQARGFAVAAQGLHEEQTSTLPIVQRIGLLQMDPLTRVARAHLLTCAARMTVQ